MQGKNYEIPRQREYAQIWNKIKLNPIIASDSSRKIKTKQKLSIMI